jgi:hypothetical protein
MKNKISSDINPAAVKFDHCNCVRFVNKNVKYISIVFK